MSRQFWRATGIRAVKTVCQTAAALIGTNAMGITDVDWLGVVSGAALAGIVSVLTSVSIGLPEVEEDEEQKESKKPKEDEESMEDKESKEDEEPKESEKPKEDEEPKEDKDA